MCQSENLNCPQYSGSSFQNREAHEAANGCEPRIDRTRRQLSRLQMSSILRPDVRLAAVVRETRLSA